MKTTIIILAIIIILLVIHCILQSKDNKTTISEYKNSMRREKEEAEEKEIMYMNQLRKTYESAGDTFHYLHYMFEKGPCKYIPLITSLGEYVRLMYASTCYQCPLSHVPEYWFKPEEHKFEGLDDEENKQMHVFLKEIKDGERNPVELLELLCYLTDPERDFKNALNQTIAMSKNK